MALTELKNMEHPQAKACEITIEAVMQNV